MSNNKVTISKAVSLDDVPAEIRTMVDKVQKELCYTIPDIARTLQMKIFSNNGDEFFKSEGILEYLRKEMLKIDTSLEECAGIISGYKDIMLNESSTEQQTNPQDNSDELKESDPTSVTHEAGDDE